MKPSSKNSGPRVNHNIRIPEIQVVDQTGTSLGVMKTYQAISLAKSSGLDLVEINPKMAPPLCKILDFGKYKYEEKKRLSQSKKKQHVIDTKEVKLRPVTDHHDLEIKANSCFKFLSDGDKVRIVVRFRGREITHSQLGFEHINYIIAKCESISTIDLSPKMDGKSMIAVLAPLPSVIKNLIKEKNIQLKEEEVSL